MRAYGLPRFSWVEYPDQADLKAFALKSSIGYLKKKGGDYPSCMRSTQKSKFRRYYKNRARQETRTQIRLEITSLYAAHGDPP